MFSIFYNKIITINRIELDLDVHYSVPKKRTLTDQVSKNSNFVLCQPTTGSAKFSTI